MDAELLMLRLVAANQRSMKRPAASQAVAIQKTPI